MCVVKYKFTNKTGGFESYDSHQLLCQGDVRVCGDAVLRYFWCGFALIFILTRGIAVSKY